MLRKYFYLIIFLTLFFSYGFFAMAKGRLWIFILFPGFFPYYIIFSVFYLYQKIFLMKYD